MLPRFDSPVLAALNVAGMAIFAYAAVRWLGATRAGRRPRWLDLLILFHVSVMGVYVPLMPLVWLRELGRERSDRSTFDPAEAKGPS